MRAEAERVDGEWQRAGKGWWEVLIDWHATARGNGKGLPRAGVGVTVVRGGLVIWGRGSVGGVVGRLGVRGMVGTGVGVKVADTSFMEGGRVTRVRSR